MRDDSEEMAARRLEEMRDYLVLSTGRQLVMGLSLSGIAGLALWTIWVPVARLDGPVGALVTALFCLAVVVNLALAGRVIRNAFVVLRHGRDDIRRVWRGGFSVDPLVLIQLGCLGFVGWTVLG